ncbi:MAG: hypothetical protein ACLU4J_08150 [Butyricimonas paravirosa]
MAGDRSGEHRGNRTFQEFPCASVRTFFCMCNIATFVINLTSLRHWNRHHPVHGLRRQEATSPTATREYLSNKVAEANRMALRLAVYSSAVFILFHCLSSGFSEGFISQLMAICSLLCLRTLYVGLNQLTALDVQYRKSAIVIIGLLVIVSPIIIQQLLMIMFRIPTIYA